MTTAVGKPPTESPALSHRRSRAAVASILLSVGIHVLIFALLASVTLSKSLHVPRSEIDQLRLKPVRVVDVKPEPPPKKEEKDFTKERGSAPGGDMGMTGKGDAPTPDRDAVPVPAPQQVPLAGEGTEVAMPDAPIAPPEAWVPRQEILEIERKIAGPGDGALARRDIPKIERIQKAPDIAPPAPITAESHATVQWRGADVKESLSTIQLADLATGRAQPTAGESQVGSDDALAKTVRSLFPGGNGTIAGAGVGPKSLDEFLRVRVELYETESDPNYGYIRLFIERKDEATLPVLPKDIVLVQDSSASIAEKRLFFCRDGLLKCLREIRPDDRFNVVRFKEKSELCFPDWAKVGPAEVDAAERFVGVTEAGGNTDIYRSIKDLLALPRDKSRPMIVFLVTDGLATMGVTDSSDIIGEFTAQNEGGMSIFSLGTIRSANWYLLDLLSYCNRGTSRVVTEGRWDIPAAMTSFMTAFSRPVLSDVSFRFSSGSALEMFPVHTGNLYLDQPLVLHGRYRRGLTRLTFQAIGQAGDVPCDMVFDIPFKPENRVQDPDIRTTWARQKIYHLMGSMARTKSEEDRLEILKTSQEYTIDVPHRDRVQ